MLCVQSGTRDPSDLERPFNLSRRIVASSLVLPSSILNFCSTVEAPIEPVNPCQPSPCGPNAQCRVVNDSPSCTCSLGFVGAPPNCKPECVSNSECSASLACVNQKCRDPCPGACGSNTECRVVSHTPMCVCISGYTGDPFTQCIVQQRKIEAFLPLSVRSKSLLELTSYGTLNCSDDDRERVTLYTVTLRSERCLQGATGRRFLRLYTGLHRQSLRRMSSRVRGELRLRLEHGLCSVQVSGSVSRHLRSERCLPGDQSLARVYLHGWIHR